MLASGAAVIGLVVLVVALITVGVRTLEAAQASDVPCLEAYAADAHDSHIRYSAFPPQSVCTWTVDGTREQVVVAQAPPAVVTVAGVLGGGGVVATVALVLLPRLRARRLRG